MTPVVGCLCVLAGLALAVLQARRAAVSTTARLRLGDVGRALPSRYRGWTSIGIAVLLTAGALLVGHGQPRWVFYVALLAAGVLTAAAQTLVLRRGRVPAAH
jgi:hypothetical protein